MKRKFWVYIILIFNALNVYSRDIEEIKKSGVIYAAFTESSFKSINYQIALEFAKFLNVKLQPIMTTWDQNLSQNGVIPPDLKENPNVSYTPDALKQADFICGTIYIYDWRKKLFDYAGILQVSDLLVVRKKSKEFDFLTKLVIPSYLLDNFKTKEIRTIQDLKGTTIALMDNTSYKINLSQINSKLGNSIQIIPCNSEEEAQKLFIENKVDGFVTVSSLALEFINKNSTIAKLAFPIGKPVDVGWTVEKNNFGLANEINNFFETIIGNELLNELFQQVYGIDYKTYLDIINSYSDAIETDLRTFEDIISSRKLIVALRQRDMIFQPEGKKQFSHQLIEDFARFLNLELEIRPIKSISEIFTADDGKIYKDSVYTPKLLKEVDIVCDILAPINWRLSKAEIIGYLPNAIIVVGKKDLKITTAADLKRYKGVTEKGSSYENILIYNKIKNYEYAPSSILLNLVETGKYDYTLVSIDIYELSKYQNIEAKFIIGEIEFAGWAIKKNDPKLKQKILEFFDYAKRNIILDKYFKQQTGMPFKATEKFLTALHQTYNIGFFPFTLYGTEEGLPNERINSVYQDIQGHIWFATNSGAIRYNGRRMEQYSTNNKLICNDVNDIKQDNKNIIYFATQRGISVMLNNKIDTLIKEIPYTGIYIDEFDNKFFYGKTGITFFNNKDIIHFNNISLQKISNINSITQIPSQKEYFISSENGLFIINIEKNTFKVISNIPTYFVFVDSDNYAWISTRDGLFYNELSLVLNKHIGQPINKKININNKIYKIIQTKDEAIWLVSDFNVYQVFSINLSTIVYDQVIGLKAQKITSFYVDKEDNIWFGYENGVKKLTNRSLRIIYPNSLSFNLKKILQDELNNFIILSNNKIYIISDTLINISSKIKQKDIPLAIALKDGILYQVTQSGITSIDINTLKDNNLFEFNVKVDNIDNLFCDNSNNLYIVENNFSKCLKLNKNQIDVIESEHPCSIFEISQIDSTVFATTNIGLAKINLIKNKLEFLQNTKFSIYTIKKIGQTTYLGTEDGVYVFKDNSMKKIYIRNISSLSVTAIEAASNSNYIWVGTFHGINYVNLLTQNTELVIDKKDGLPGDEITIGGIKKDLKGLIWIQTKHGVATFDIKKLSSTKHTPDCSVEKIILNSQSIDTLPNVLSHNQNNITFELSGLSFKNEQAIVYDYYLRGKNKVYESLSQVPYIAAYQNLPPGNYTFLFRTKGKDGIWSYYQALNFTIKKPWWLRWWALALFSIFAIMLIFTIVKIRERALKAKNEELERIVVERTSEIVQQKSEIEEKNAELEQQQEEILAQRDELARQKDLAEEQRDQISKQKEEIMDSIYYAKRIQNAILPPKEVLNTIIPESFILYIPRDIVSGDFYWIKKIENNIIIATADCTGHGVPGAFMSMLGVSLLNEIVLRNAKNLVAGQILNELRTSVVTSLHQTGKLEEAKDGMDMSLYILDIKNHKLQFSGAFNSMAICRGEEIIDLPADRMPIGIFEEDKETPFSTHYFEPQLGDIMYTYSDGYASQFGGPNGKKFKQSRFEKLLQTIKDKPMNEQKNILDITLKTWMGVKYAQIDDIIVIGVKYIWE
mgnify:CR=1 FL=1